MQSELIMEYFRSPVNNFEPDTYTITHHEGNKVCGDDITIFLTLDETTQTIISLHYTWSPSMVTSAAASFTADLIASKPIEEVIKRDYNTLKEEWFEVSTRRQRAAVITLVAVRNAINTYHNKQIVTTFDDLLDSY